MFYTIPQSNDDFGADTWEDGSWRFTGHANVWGLMSLDVDRGLLYIPTSTPSSDYYGGRRLGANLFAESLVCLDARTGERVWHFQAVHHGLWDYDFTSAPNLMTLQVDGRTIDAVAEVSKQGFTYVFDRVTGEPVWPIEERPRRHRHRCAGGGAVSDTAVSNPAAAVRRPGHLARRCERSDTRGPAARTRGAAHVSSRPVVHAAEPAGDAAAAIGRRRRKLGWCGARPGHELALRADVGTAVAQPDLRDAPRPAARRPRLHQQLSARRVEQRLPGAARLCAGRAKSARTDSAHQAALREARRHRPRRRRHRLERAVRRGESGRTQPSVAGGRRAARTGSAPGAPMVRW